MQNEPREPWTEAELALLHKHYANLNNEDIALFIKTRSVSAISKKAFRLGLKKSDAFLNSPNSGRFRPEVSLWQKIKNFIINLFAKS
jgi:hypothetical protein